MIIKHRISHICTLREYISIQKKILIERIKNYSVKPVRENITFCFVIGCGHSGTTLVTAKLSQHPLIYTLGEETKIFLPIKNISSSKNIVMEWVQNARENNKSIVLEKTPKHVHSVKIIKRLIPDSKFIAMIRNPLDNCASLYKRFDNLEYAVQRWILDNIALLKNRNQKNIMIIKYESLTENPDLVFKEVVKYLKIEWNNDILNNGPTIYDKTNLKDNMIIRKDQVREKIRQNKNGWKKVFDSSQKQFVIERTRKISQLLGYSFNEMD